MLSDVAEFLVEKGLPHSIASVDWGGSCSYKPITIFTVARGEKELYIRFLVHGNCLRAVYATDQQPVSEDSCVGLVLQRPDQDKVYEFAFNCIGTCAATYGTLQKRDFYNIESLRQIRRFCDLDHRPFYEMEGIFKWQLTLAIPFSLLGLDSLPEKFCLKGNFYKRADATSLPHYLSWVPVETNIPDFVAPESFGELTFV